MYKRLINLNIASRQSLFLWGPRQTGKSTLLRLLFPQALCFDLLNATEFRLLKSRPEVLRERCRTWDTKTGPVIIDEIQKIPELLDEVQWSIENLGVRFILSGSSARKLRRAGQNLLGGRAVRRELFHRSHEGVKLILFHHEPSSTRKATMKGTALMMHGAVRRTCVV